MLYGHERGLRILWRGGRRRKQPSTAHTASQTNGARDHDPIVIDDDDDEPRIEEQTAAEDEYETDEEEQDSDCPYPAIIQDVEVVPGKEVLHMAVPTLPSSTLSHMPSLMRSNLVVALACSDGRVLLVAMPLAPPLPSGNDGKTPPVNPTVRILKPEKDGDIANDLSMKILPGSDEQNTGNRTQSNSTDSAYGGRLILAAASKSLKIWSLKITAEAFAAPDTLQPLVPFPLCGARVSFQASPSSTLLLLADRLGEVHVYDVPITGSDKIRPSSRDSETAQDGHSEGSGMCIMTFTTPFHAAKEISALARRKKVLDAAWVLSGRGILVLLEDGEWGVYDVYGLAKPTSHAESFAIRGYLGSSSTTEESGKLRKGNSKLAPMTPNTRKSKAENLFSGSPKAPGVAATGGISIRYSSTKSGQLDESVIMWYDNEIYSITSMQSFWQRSTSGTTGGFGSLHAPGLIHISDINLMNENITSISQFAARSTSTNFGQMNTQRDLLVSAENRFVILHSLRPPTPGKELFQQVAARPHSRDQTMLDAGELDLGGLDRMLDNMAGDGRTRKVGFAG